MTQRTPLFLNWQASNTFGWGILGLNLFCQFANDPEIQPLLAKRLEAGDMAMLDPLRLLAIEAAREVSNRFVDVYGGRFDAVQFPVIDALGNELRPASALRGSLTIGRTIFEQADLSDLDRRLDKYDLLLCASHWNRQLLEAHSHKPVAMIHEGVDHALFFPAPRSGWLDPTRFYVFSGGKIEYRKGQDLVLRAFRIFAAKHPDAVLVASWHSPWPRISAGFQGTAAAPLQLDAGGRLDLQRWVAENGINPVQFIDIGPIPNPLMPAVLREMDCALQVSRAEACTNLPAKEAMACGVATVLACNTGVLDLANDDNCLPLRHQGPVDARWVTDAALGWGESSVDEIVAALETLYDDHERRLRIGATAARFIVEQGRTWAAHAAALKHLVLSSAAGGMA